MKIAIGADHAGLELKNKILSNIQKNYQIIDVGAHNFDPNDDYPDFSQRVAELISNKTVDRGVLICGSGVGATIASNKVPGVRASVCHDLYSANQGVEHDDMNVLCLGGRIIGEDLSKEIVTSFLQATFIREPRFQRRLDKLLSIEKEYTQRDL